MATWPTTLPAPSAPGFGFQPVDPVVRTEMTSGPKRARRQFTQIPTNCTARFIFTTAQMATFESFHKNDIASGTSWFDGFPFINGQGKTLVTARFSEMFTAVFISGQWEVSAKLEIQNRPVA